MRLSRGDSSWQNVLQNMDPYGFERLSQLDYYVSVDSHKYLLKKIREMEALTELES